MNIEKQIEFDKIKEKWMELAITDQAKDLIRNISFYLSDETDFNECHRQCPQV